uniref:Uncharacterized protein n=1 Tax=Oryza brachyantha TaxID=4533 RepID=J3NED2_ORYBR
WPHLSATQCQAIKPQELKISPWKNKQALRTCGSVQGWCFFFCNIFCPSDLL